ncbi:MAG TPA: hypothetical protein VM692_16290 [Gammaproteobacteria bacterium]|nr:hypothetical protein [Gammaproteobacteria bacterium]
MTGAELEDLVRRFHACEVPRREWTHAAHLSVGLWHVSRYGAADALARLRDGIRRLNESNGVVNSAASGYHETITWAYVQLLAAFAERHADAPVAERVARLLASDLADRGALLKFYSRPHLESADARLGLVEPDLAPLELDSVFARQAGKWFE